MEVHKTDAFQNNFCLFNVYLSSSKHINILRHLFFLHEHFLNALCLGSCPPNVYSKSVVPNLRSRPESRPAQGEEDSRAVKTSIFRFYQKPQGRKVFMVAVNSYRVAAKKKV